MYVDSSSITVNHKTYTRHLLRTSFRKDGKVKHRTIANISSCSDEEIQAVKLGLKYKGNLAELASLDKSMKLQQGLRVGAVWVLLCLAKQLHIVDALGAGRQAKLALWQIMARIIEHSSRLSAVRLARSHAVCDLLDLDSFNEDDLYANLDWLHENQSKIEDRLFRATHQDSSTTLFLYDVTSSYLEGTHNDLGAFGYNRDGKSGKQQIVLGLLCDDQGVPLSIEVFPGNTSDTKTFASQVHKVAERFGGGEVTFVGDRGMIKGPQIQLLKEHEDNFHYISALTKPQIEGLLKKGILQMSLFDEAIAEVLSEEGGERFVVRRNPIRAEEMKRNRQDRLDSLNNRVEKYNAYLEEHPKAKVEVGLRRMKDNATRLKIHKWIEIEPRGTKLSLQVNPEELAAVEKLDGCYALRTDLSPTAASKQTIHDRYKDLALVEWAFRTSKTGHLEMRPLFLRREARTRGHAFVVELAYRMIQTLSKQWRQLDLTVEQGIDLLSTLCAQKVSIHGKASFQTIPEPCDEVKALLDALDITMPDAIPDRGVVVSTRKKLPENRVKQ